MGRRNDRGRSHGGPPANFEIERTLAAAEEDLASELPEVDLAGAGEGEGPASTSADARCTCGSNEFLLEAYLRVVDGRPSTELVEVESLTCPQCGKEYEAVQMEDGRVLRGEFLGNVELDDED